METRGGFIGCESEVVLFPLYSCLVLLKEFKMTSSTRPHHDRISQDPAIMVGKPVIKGTRVPVERVLAHLAENPDLDEVFAAFPHLTLDDVKACLAYARDLVA